MTHVYVIARTCMVTPGQAKKVQLGCLGFYGESRTAPAFTSEENARTWLKLHGDKLHPVKPHYPGQSWDVERLEVGS